MTETSFVSHSEQETEQRGRTFADRLSGGETVALYGDLGAGKTAFVRGALRALGYTGEVTSPTFAIVNEYRDGRLPAAHFDMYRIGNEDELYSTGFYDYLDGKQVLFIEWSENIPWALDGSEITVRITGSADEPREISITGGGAV